MTPRPVTAMETRQIFAMGGGTVWGFSFKASDMAFELLPQQGVARPAPYLQRAKWLALTAPDALPDDDLRAYVAEAHAIGSTVDTKDFAGRVDCRSHQVITIDPDDAKDFDDAICLEKISPEQWRLWVHIADVSHYVKPGTALDAEAEKRGNSTYLVDRVIPMLPEALSNELCSLKPSVDRLTKCVEFIVANDGRVISTKFHSAVIHSQRRFAYKHAVEQSGRGAAVLRHRRRKSLARI